VGPWADPCNWEIYEATWSPPALEFRRGDANTDSALEFSDAINTLEVLFLRKGQIACEDASDANDDGMVDISDAVTTLGVLFLGQGEIPPPGYSQCGPDPTIDELGCTHYESCE
jgi:hypothetical protein